MHRYTLDNGLTLSIQPERTLPLVTMDMWVRVGSGDEPTELAGVSHFLEHMMFKGTERLATGEYDRLVEEAGGYLNAGTSFDYTHYYVTIPSRNFEEILTHFADVMVNSILDPQEVENERLVILEEISRKTDNPFGHLFDATFPRLFSSGPYRHPVIGTQETVSAMTRDQLYEHYQRYYAPSNMFLNIAGDVDPEEARRLVEEAFSGFDRDYRPWREAPPQTSFALPRDEVLPHNWNEAYFILAFPGPETTGRRRMALMDLGQTVLAGGRSSRLVNSLREKQGLVSNIGASFLTQRHPAPLMIYGTCRPEDLPRVREAIFAELEKLEREGISQREIQRVRRIARNSHVFSLETNAGRAETMGFSQLMLGDTSLLNGYEDDLQSIRRREILEFLGNALREENASLFATHGSADGNGREP